MVYVHRGRVAERRSLLDPKRYLELLQNIFSGIVFFFVTIISPSAAGRFIDGRKKKRDDPRAGVQEHWSGHQCCAPASFHAMITGGPVWQLRALLVLEAGAHACRALLNDGDPLCRKSRPSSFGAVHPVLSA
jgi:Selenoprotein SelK_SelG